MWTVDVGVTTKDSRRKFGAQRKHKLRGKSSCRIRYRSVSTESDKWYIVWRSIRQASWTKNIYGKRTVTVQRNNVKSEKETAPPKLEKHHAGDLETLNTFPRFKMVLSCPHCPTILIPTGHPSSPSPTGTLNAGRPASEAGTVSTS